MQLLELQEVDMLKESHKSPGTEKQYKIHREFYLKHNPPPITAGGSPKRFALIMASD
jgi:hypothetical protein